jgi:hypothetical protein
VLFHQLGNTSGALNMTFYLLSNSNKRLKNIVVQTSISKRQYQVKGIESLVRMKTHFYRR